MTGRLMIKFIVQIKGVYLEKDQNYNCYDF